MTYSHKVFPSSKKCAKSLSWALSKYREDAQDSDLHIFWRMKLKWKTEIKPPLTWLFFSMLYIIFHLIFPTFWPWISCIFPCCLKGQLIAKANSFEPKKQRKYFCISAIASKSGRIKKNKDPFLWLTPF